MTFIKFLTFLFLPIFIFAENGKVLEASKSVIRIITVLENKSLISGTAFCINSDGYLNIIDVVQLVNCLMTGNCALVSCGGDMNEDGGYNILDVVGLVNCILNYNCGE